MAELFWDAEPAEAYGRLVADPAQSRLLASIDRVLDQLEADPGDRSVRGHRFSNGLWAVIATGNDEDWALLWESGTAAELLREDRPGDVDEASIVVAIRYLGSDTFM